MLIMVPSLYNISSSPSGKTSKWYNQHLQTSKHEYSIGKLNNLCQGHNFLRPKLSWPNNVIRECLNTTLAYTSCYTSVCQRYCFRTLVSYILHFVYTLFISQACDIYVLHLYYYTIRTLPSWKRLSNIDLYKTMIDLDMFHIRNYRGTL